MQNEKFDSKKFRKYGKIRSMGVAYRPLILTNILHVSLHILLVLIKDILFQNKKTL